MTFSKDDILDALGISEERSIWPIALVGFGVGCLVGAGVSMLLAPKTGRELRGDIADKGRQLFQKGKEVLGQENLGVGMGEGIKSPY